MDLYTKLALVQSTGVHITRLDAGLDLRETLTLVAQTARRLLDSPGIAVIYLYDRLTQRFLLKSRILAGEESVLGPVVPRRNGIGAIALARQTRILSYEETELLIHPRKLEAGIRTSACYPLLTDDHPAGVLYIDLWDKRSFSIEELHTLDTLVQLATVAIYNRQHYEALQHRLRHRADELKRLQAALGPVAESGWRRDLTDREREVLALMTQGFTNREIGAYLHVAPNTVKKHVDHIFQKLHVNNRAGAVAAALKAGFPA